MERLHILDGYGYIFRAYYALMTGGPDRRGVRLTTSQGMPTGALYVYANMLIRLYLDEHPDRIAVVFDAPGPSFRSELDAEYKATRRETPDDLRVQMPYFRRLTEALCWPVLATPGVEADDVIATLVERARANGWDVVIYSADKDLMQLVGDHVVVIDAMRQQTYDAARVTDKFGVPPEKVADWLALVGDTSDNIPGVAGVGPKRAADLLGRFGDIGGILAGVGSLKGKLKESFSDPDQLARLELSRQLVALRTDVDIDRDLEELVPSQWDGAALTALLRELEFTALIERLAASRPEGAVRAAEAEAGPAPEVALDAAALAEVAEAARAAGRIAVEVEPDGDRDDRARLVGMALAVPGRAPVYVPFSHRYLSAPAQLSPAELPAALVEVLADPDVAVFCHDAKTAMKVLAGHGIDLGGVRCDTMLAAYLLDASDQSFEVDRVIAGATGTRLPARKSLLGKGKGAIGFEGLGIDEAAAYSGAIAAALVPAGDVLLGRLDAAGMGGLLRDLELPLARVLAEIERTGITVDVPYLRALSTRIAADIARIERHVFEIAGEPINLGSPKQLSAFLFDRLGLRGGRMKKKKTGYYSTDHEVLDSLRDEHPVIRLILEHRELCKLKGTYIDALPPLVNPTTGRLHTTFRQAVAATGRLSSQDPNLQNIPIRTELGREIRRAFVAADGMTLVSGDYSQIELRIMAHLSGDPVLSRAFRDGIDVHTQTAAEVFDIPIDEVGPDERRVAKAVNYGLIYGQSDFGLARALDIPRAEARLYIERYFQRFATVRRFMDTCVERARGEGGAVTILGRRRPIPALSSNNYRLRTAAERVAQNTPMQGSAADIIKLAMLRVSDKLRETRFQARMLLTVHDELVFEVARDQAEEFGRFVTAEMEAAYELKVPLEVDVGIADNWADAH